MFVVTLHKHTLYTLLEEFDQKQMKKMQSLLERQDKRKNSIKNGVGVMTSYVDDEMGVFKSQVLHINFDDTSTIDTIAPQHS